MSLSDSGLRVRVDATERTRERLQALVREKRLRQTRLADLLGIGAPSVNKYIRQNTPITVAFLEAVEQVTGIPIAELVAPPGTTHQLNAEEAAILRRLRAWPASVMHALGAFLAFFADEPPEARMTRNLHELWRGLDHRDREWLYGVAVMLRERSLAPDHLTGLADQLKAEVAAQKAAKRRRDDA